MPAPADSEDRATISCSRRQTCCCQLKVLVMANDDVPQWLLTRDAHAMEVMRQRDDGWRAALDRDNLRCTIYARRLRVCRDFAMGDSDCRAGRASWRRGAASLA